MSGNLHQPVWDNTLGEMLDRNGAVEVEVISAPGVSELPPRQRLRPFGYDRDTGTLIVERFRPTKDFPKAIGPRSRVDVYLVTEKVRLVRSYELKEVEPFQLNERQRVTVMRLTRVGEARSAQRRASFRVDTSASDYAEVTLNQPGPDGRQLRPVKAHMVNLSASGVALQISLKAFPEPPRVGHKFDFVLPRNDAHEGLTAPITLRRVQSGPVGTLVLGFEFGLDNTNPKHHHLAESLNRLSTNLQREQLRKRRGA